MDMVSSWKVVKINPTIFFELKNISPEIRLHEIQPNFRGDAIK